MRKLDQAALGMIPLSKEAVNYLYELDFESNLWANARKFKTLCESHERLRMELEGTIALLADAIGSQQEK